MEIALIFYRNHKYLEVFCVHFGQITFSGTGRILYLCHTAFLAVTPTLDFCYWVDLGINRKLMA